MRTWETISSGTISSGSLITAAIYFAAVICFAAALYLQRQATHTVSQRQYNSQRHFLAAALSHSGNKVYILGYSGKFAAVVSQWQFICSGSPAAAISQRHASRSLVSHRQPPPYSGNLTAAISQRQASRSGTLRYLRRCQL